MTTTLDSRALGSCAGMDPEFFFPGRGCTIQLREAVAICSECPVRAQCAEWGIAHEAFGVWGGLSERARKAERKARGITLQTPSAEQLHGDACGTMGGHRRHMSRGEKACQACNDARARHLNPENVRPGNNMRTGEDFLERARSRRREALEMLGATG